MDFELIGETVQELTAESTGRWLVTSQGTQHIWDLDAMTYTRMPSSASKSGAMEFDHRPMRLTRVVWWPKVGERPYLWYDDPEYPAFWEHYRISSVIKSIERLADNDVEGGRCLRLLLT
ncbi:hypothetical protein [Nesterenkonia ebinurensis]|uniref:hypothetical protein n=1 Tax=Nesterenkonia ebinurensis TaxID=2608252 RepID=UPI00123D2928|nr:hypothetical protein [Nesterenkonia ebinurensis]